MRATVTVIFSRPASNDQINIGALRLHHESDRNTALDSVTSSLNDEGTVLTVVCVEDQQGLPPDMHLNYLLELSDLSNGVIRAEMEINDSGEVGEMPPIEGIFFAVDGDIAVMTAAPDWSVDDTLPPSIRVECLDASQRSALRCAEADLEGAMQTRDQMDAEVHDWEAHGVTLDELRDAFPTILCDDTQPSNKKNDP